ncbi:hypothetical protein GEMRC1_009130 [Eukaryota sp. GEM-RC1]
MFVSRSTDSSIIYFTYCFKKPVISFVSPYPFLLNGELSIIGKDLSTSFDYSSLVSEIASTRVSNHSHEEIVHYIPYVCSVESNIFNVYVIIGNQTSNVFQLQLIAPRHGVFPLVLSPSGNILRIFGSYFGQMFNCFSNSTIQMSGSSAVVQDLTTNEMIIYTGELVGLNRFITRIEFTTGISIILSLPITSLEAYNTSLVCFVNQPCEINVYSLYGEVSLNDFQVTLDIPNFIEIVNFQTTPHLAHIEFMSSVPGYPDDLELCSEVGCYPIFNLPFIVSPNSISPRFIQWFESSFVHEISLEVEGIHFYEYSAIQSSFIFGELASELSIVEEDLVTFEVDVISIGFFIAFGRSFASAFDLKLAFEVDNYLVLPPLIQNDSRIEFLLLEEISNIYLSHGRQNMLLKRGSNVFELYDDDPFITLHQSPQSLTVALMTDLIDDQFPFFYEVAIHQSFTVNFNQYNYSISVECISNCEILDQESLHGSLILNFFSVNQGESSFEFNVEYLESSFSFQLIREVVLPPTISITSPLFFSTIDDVIVQISVLSKCPLFSDFQLKNLIVSSDQIQLFEDDYATFRFSYTYSFNISSFSFSLGESDLQWTWKHIGFQKSNYW